MPISNLSSGFRPGVCTSTTRPSSPYEGQMIYETDTNRVLVWDNAAWIMVADTDQPPALQLIKTQAIGSAVSTVPVSNVFSSDYDSYLVTISGGVASVGNALGIQLGSTTSGYSYSFVYNGYTNTVTGLGTTTGANFVYAGGGNTTSLHMHCVLTNPQLAEHTYCFATSVNASWAGTMNGYLPDTTQYTAFTVVASTGTITGGTIRVYGYRNS